MPGDQPVRFEDLQSGSLTAALRAVLVFVNSGEVPTGAPQPGADDAPVAERARAVVRGCLVEPGVADVAAANALAEEFPVRLRFDLRGGYAACDLDPVPVGFGAWIAWSLAVLHSALAAGYADRIKTCRNDECGWLFLDESRNRSRQWCDMSACGSRMKARAYRARQRARQ